MQYKDQIPAIVISEGGFGDGLGKSANGLARFSRKYALMGIVDSRHVGKTADQVLEAAKPIPIFGSMEEAYEKAEQKPQCIIMGLATYDGMFPQELRSIFIKAMEMGMDVVNGLHEFLTEDEEFIRVMERTGRDIWDIRKPPKKREMRVLNGEIYKKKTPVVLLLGTDGGVGKRTTQMFMFEKLEDLGISVRLVTTGQTGAMQGARHRVAVDALPAEFISGAVERKVVDACEHGDIVIVGGQGALDHPAYITTAYIIRGSNPDAIILQVPPARKTRAGFSQFELPPVKEAMSLIEHFAGTKIVAISINHEGMSHEEVDAIVKEYEETFGIPTFDPIWHGVDKAVDTIVGLFPELTPNK